MTVITGEGIFSSKRFLKLVEFSLQLGGNKTRTAFRIALRKTLNDSVRTKVEKNQKNKLRAGLHRAASLIQVLIFKKSSLENESFEEMFPLAGERWLLGFIFDSKYDDFESNVPENNTATDEFRVLFSKDLSDTSKSLAENFQEIVLIMREIIDEI